jgi:hypothetical protein
VHQVVERKRRIGGLPSIGADRFDASTKDIPFLSQKPDAFGRPARRVRSILPRDLRHHVDHARRPTNLPSGNVSTRLFGKSLPVIQCTGASK